MPHPLESGLDSLSRGELCGGLRLFESLLKGASEVASVEERDRTLYWAGRTALKTSDAERADGTGEELLRDYPVKYYTSSLLDFVAMRILRQAGNRGEQGGHAGE